MWNGLPAHLTASAHRARVSESRFRFRVAPALGALLTAGLLALATSGCGPRLSEDELGTIVVDLKEVPGADDPYILPAPDYDEPGETGSESGDDARGEADAPPGDEKAQPAEDPQPTETPSPDANS
jgi:hypothetical protein